MAKRIRVKLLMRIRRIGAGRVGGVALAGCRRHVFIDASLGDCILALVNHISCEIRPRGCVAC